MKNYNYLERNTSIVNEQRRVAGLPNTTAASLEEGPRTIKRVEVFELASA